jgi:uncharacterized repeat protein (TIGR01451 family)
MNTNVSTSVLERSVRGALALSLLAVALAATGAFASTAANTTISNTATVTFDDPNGVAQTPVTATASVTVALVPSAVVLSSPIDQAISQGTSATLSYTITATANGPDSYDLSSAATAVNVSGVTVTLPASITLGGTTLAADANDGATTIAVPYDGVGGASVNGIGAGDTIMIGANAYTVASVSKNPGANTAAIELSSPIAGGTVASGQVVGERAILTATVPSGTITSGGAGTQTVSTTATSATAPNPATTQDTPTVITVNRAMLTVTKTVSTDGGASFAATGSAPPGAVLVYKIIATNTGASAASAVSFTDVIPAYLTYVPGSGRYATSSATSYAAATALTEGAGGYTYTAGSSTAAYAPGPAIGTVAGGGGELVLFYRTTIN